MKKYYLIFFIAMFLIGCRDHNKPNPPVEEPNDTITYKVDTLLYMCAAAYTWDLHSIVDPYLIFIEVVHGDIQDTTVYALPSKVDTLNINNGGILYADIFSNDRVPDTLKASDLGLKYYEFSRVIKRPVYWAYEIRTAWAYKKKDVAYKENYYVGSWELNSFIKRNNNSVRYWGGGGHSHRLSNLPLEEVVPSHLQAVDVFKFRGEEYLFSGYYDSDDGGIPE